MQSGGGQRDGTASFQLLRMENGVPKAGRKSTLRDFLLRRSWPYAVAAVGLPAWSRTSTSSDSSLCSLRESIMEVAPEFKHGGLSLHSSLSHVLSLILPLRPLIFTCYFNLLSPHLLLTLVHFSSSLTPSALIYTFRFSCTLTSLICF